MKVAVQEFTPYQDSLKWDIHNQYYQSKGQKAWQNHDIPFNITSNYRAAWQKAKLIVESLIQQKISANETIYVLETGGGLGLFAYYFIQAFKDICIQTSLPYIKQLKYFLTDYSKQTLLEIADFAQIKQLQNEKILELYVLDASQPDTMVSLKGNSYELNYQQLSAVISNYQHCCFPIAILKAENEQFHQKWIDLNYIMVSVDNKVDQAEKHSIYQSIIHNLIDELNQVIASDDQPEDPKIKLFYYFMIQGIQRTITHFANEFEIPPEDPDLDIKEYLRNYILQTSLTCFIEKYKNDIKDDEDFQLKYDQFIEELAPVKELFTQLIQIGVLDSIFNPMTLSLNNLNETSKYLPVKLSAICADKYEIDTLKHYAKKFKKATIPYPFLTLKSIKLFLRKLKNGGVILISDKALLNETDMVKHNDFTSTIHGNSIAHLVNFPLIEHWLKIQNISSMRTNDELDSIFNMMIINSPEVPKAINQRFSELFIERNLNLECHDYLVAGQNFLSTQKYSLAEIYFKKALRFRPEDTTLNYFLGLVNFNNGKSEVALEYLLKSEHDEFQKLNFPIVIAGIYTQLMRYEEAIEYYHKAIEFEENSALYFNIGYCWQELKNDKKAYKFYKIALALNPDDKDIPRAISEIKERVFLEWKESLN